MTAFGEHIEGETPIDDISGLKIKGITTRAELNQYEADNINEAAFKKLVRSAAAANSAAQARRAAPKK